MERFSEILEEVKKPFTYLVLSNQRIYWVYLLTAILCAFGVFLYYQRKNEKVSLRGFLHYCFPKSIYFHKSALVDYGYFIINRILFAVLISPFLILLYPALTKWIYQTLSQALGPIAWKVDNFLVFNSCFTLVSVLALDFGIFLAHRLQHRIPFLWEFHKVHHSAEVMTPLTVYRMHPVDDILAFVFSSSFAGVAGGLFSYLCGNGVNAYSFWGVNIVVLLFYLVGYNLRHSHIWFSFGPTLEKIFISPALHQIHHSTDPKHFDKNMGFIFSIWDRLFKTLYLPKKKEDLTFGLGSEETKEYSSVWKLYALPFFKNSNSFYHRILVFVLLLSLFCIGFYNIRPYLEPYDKAFRSKAGTVFIEDMTSSEVAKSIKEGKRIVLVPTGGVEQNGPHMILGKHNYVIKYTCEEIARRLGDALVAPVLPYVPEGKINPPSGHMRYAGTISIPEQVFENVLEYTARSLRSHGFEKIYFIGDSGGNQAGQSNVTNKLNQEWKLSGVTVHNITDYYSKNNQVKWLLKEGETKSTIGGHAGIRDTSELLYVYPKGVRKDKIRDYDPNFQGQGYSGASDRASASRGKQLLEFKIQAAVKQIRKSSLPQPAPN